MLKRHPDSRSFAAVHIEVEVARSRAECLVLSYIVTGKMSDVLMPTIMAAARRELWRHTCFEAFLCASSGSEYYEFNFAPSTEWAAYWFSSYRSGMRVATEISAPTIEVRSSPDCYTLQASLELDRLSALPRKVVWRLGLSALIEDTSGGKSYWALTHSPGKPDFHHADCFTYEFSPTGQT